MNTKLSVEYRDVESLSPRDRNPRKHSQKQLGLLAKSIEQFGFNAPVLISAGGTIWAGEARWRAAQMAGLTSIPTIDVSHLTAEELRLYAVADNRIAEYAKWDDDLLKLELGELASLGVDLTATALADHELQRFMRPEFNDPDTISASVEDQVRACAGEVWILGAHRLACGDATDRQTVAQLLGGEAPHLMVTDPPYGVDYDPAWRATAGLASEGIAKGKVLNDGRADWREAWELFPGSVAYVWHGGLHGAVVAQSLVVCGFRVRRKSSG